MVLPISVIRMGNPCEDNEGETINMLEMKLIKNDISTYKIIKYCLLKLAQVSKKAKMVQ